MTRDDVIKLLMTIQSAYPNYKPHDKTVAVNLWFEMFKDYDAPLVMSALKAYIASDTSGFAPSVGQLMGKINAVAKGGEEMTALEAWSRVSTALRNGYYGAEEEFAKLPPLAQKAVGSPANLRNWSQTDIKSIETVVMSQFLTAYKTVEKREQELSLIPPSVRLELKNRLKLECKEEHT